MNGSQVRARLLAMAVVFTAVDCAHAPAPTLTSPIEPTGTLSIDTALVAFLANDYATAAHRFCGALDSPNDADRGEAEYGLALVLLRTGHRLAATMMFLKIVDQGHQHPMFRTSLELLAEEGGARSDVLVIPARVDTSPVRATDGVRRTGLRALFGGANIVP